MNNKIAINIYYSFNHLSTKFYPTWCSHHFTSWIERFDCKTKQKQYIILKIMRWKWRLFLYSGCLVSSCLSTILSCYVSIPSSALLTFSWLWMKSSTIITNSRAILVNSWSAPLNFSVFSQSSFISFSRSTCVYPHIPIFLYASHSFLSLTRIVDKSIGCSITIL